MYCSRYYCGNPVLLLLCSPHHSSVIVYCHCAIALSLFCSIVISLITIATVVLYSVPGCHIFLCFPCAALSRGFPFAGCWQDVHRRYRLRQRRLPQGKPLALQVHEIVSVFGQRFSRLDYLYCGSTYTNVLQHFPSGWFVTNRRRRPHTKNVIRYAAGINMPNSNIQYILRIAHTTFFPKGLQRPKRGETR